VVVNYKAIKFIQYFTIGFATVFHVELDVNFVHE